MQTRFKCIDCKLINNALNELKRQKMIAKVKEDQYIFLQRQQPVNQRSRTKQIEAQNAQKVFKETNVRRFSTGKKVQLADKKDIAPGLKGESQMEDLLAHRPGQGYKATLNVEKRERNLFKKLLNYRVARMLQVLNYYPSQSDERKFLHSNYRNRQQIDDLSDNELSARGGDSDRASLRSPNAAAPNRRVNINSAARAYQQSSGGPRSYPGYNNTPSFTNLSQQNYLLQMQQNVFKMNEGSLKQLMESIDYVERALKNLR